MSDGYSGFDNPVMSCLCRDCIYSGRFGGDAVRPGYLCPYNKGLAIKALENISRSISAFSSLFKDFGIAVGIELKGGDSLAESGEVNGARCKCPIRGKHEQ